MCAVTHSERERQRDELVSGAHIGEEYSKSLGQILRESADIF